MTLTDADRGEHVGDFWQRSLREVGRPDPRVEARRQEANYPAAIAALEELRDREQEEVPADA
jgi:hypothetical protein